MTGSKQAAQLSSPETQSVACFVPFSVARDRLLDGIEAATALDTAGEDVGNPEMVSDLEDRTRYALLVARSALDDVSHRCEATDWSCSSEPHIIALRRLVDTAFVGRMSLSSSLNEIGAVSARTTAERVDMIDRTRRSILRTLRAADLDLCKITGLVPDLSYYLSDAAQAQRVRRAYLRFNWKVGASRVPNAETMTRRLRLVDSAASELLDGPLHKLVRNHDWQRLQDLRERARGWLAGWSTSEATTEDGLRLWQDAAAVGSVLMQINNHPDLVEADRLTLTQLHALLSTSGASREDLVRLLDAVRGRDAALDQFTAERATLDAALLRDRTREVLGRLGGKVSSSLLSALTLN